jgi:putative transcriptional regulator
MEMTLLLAGGFSDETGHYLRGDVALADPSVDHRPVADPGEDCLCLAVTDAPLRLTGRFGRYLNFLARL